MAASSLAASANCEFNSETSRCIFSANGSALSSPLPRRRSGPESARSRARRSWLICRSRGGRRTGRARLPPSRLLVVSLLPIRGSAGASPSRPSDRRATSGTCRRCRRCRRRLVRDARGRSACRSLAAWRCLAASASEPPSAPRRRCPPGTRPGLRDRPLRLLRRATSDAAPRKRRRCISKRSARARRACTRRHPCCCGACRRSVRAWPQSQDWRRCRSRNSRSPTSCSPCCFAVVPCQ